VQITDAANGQSVEVRRGQSVELVLPSNSSTGYRGTFVVAPRALAAVGDPVYQSEAKLGRVGGGGTTTWHFTTSRAATRHAALGVHPALGSERPGGRIVPVRRGRPLTSLCRQGGVQSAPGS
jgi:predicted secreted protein